MYILRAYQEEAIQAILDAIMSERYMLLQAATGAGKTIMFCELIRRLLEEYRMRVAVLAHRRELVTQAAEKLRRVWPEAPIGLACSSVSNRVNTDAPVVIGSIQTLSSRLNSTAPFHMVIIDEAHRLPPRNKPSQYRDFLLRMESYYPDLRVVGVTATPYRLGVGYIYRDRCKPGLENWFSDLHFRIGIHSLMDQGYLCGIRAREAEDIESELAGIRTSGGEYNLSDLSDLMSREIHVGSAVKAYRQYGESRRHVVVFCVTIEHAEKLLEAFRDAGYPSGCVHSEMTLQERDRVLADYENGKVRVLTNVGVLQEGWDSPQTDCILLCRPTRSAALYVQQIGRALRISPGKEDMLILDLSGNIHRHGDPDSPNVIIPGNARKPFLPVTKTCPICRTIVSAMALVCPECGYEWERPPIEERDEEVKLVDVEWKRPESRVLTLDTVQPFQHRSRAGNRMLKLVLTCFNGGPVPVRLCHFLDLEGEGSGYGRKKARMFWRQMGGDDPPPETIEDGMERFDELVFPDEIAVEQDGKYLRWRI